MAELTSRLREHLVADDSEELELLVALSAQDSGVDEKPVRLVGVEKHLTVQRLAGGWGITSNLSHPGIAPTSLLAARPEMGRADDTFGVRVIRALSARGIVVGTVETAKVPALYAATATDARRGRLYGPSGLGHLGGPAGEQTLFSRLRNADQAQRVWQVSEELTRTGS